MHALKWLFTAGKDFLLLFLFVSVIVLGVLGSLIPSQQVKLSIGSYQIARFPTGISLYVLGNSARYYDFSPFKDFLLDFNQQRSMIVTAPDGYFNQVIPAFESIHNLASVQDTLRSYFRHDVPVKFEYGTQTKVEYVASLKGNTVIIKKSVTPKSQLNVAQFGQVLEYSDADLIFEPKSSYLITQNTDQQVKDFNKLTQTQLQPLSKEQKKLEYLPIESRRLVLFHPNQPGFLLITANSLQKLRINHIWQFIEILEPVTVAKDKSFESSIQVQVFDTYDELQKAL